MFPIRDSVRARRFPFVNYLLIAANLAVFVHEVKLYNDGRLEIFLRSFSLVPVTFLADPMLRLRDVFTAMFLHGSWMHVIGNMWFLYIFGDNVEDNLGHLRYLIYYFLMGIGAAAAQVLASPDSHAPMVGASGAIAGVLGAYIVLYPRARILTFFIFIFFIRFIEIPAYFYLGLWFVTQALNGVGALAVPSAPEASGGIAWWAHIGGFASGFLAIPFFRRSR